MTVTQAIQVSKDADGLFAARAAAAWTGKLYRVLSADKEIRALAGGHIYPGLLSYKERKALDKRTERYFMLAPAFAVRDDAIERGALRLKAHLCFCYPPGRRIMRACVHSVCADALKERMFFFAGGGILPASVSEGAAEKRISAPEERYYRVRFLLHAVWLR